MGAYISCTQIIQDILCIDTCKEYVKKEDPDAKELEELANYPESLQF